MEVCYIMKEVLILFSGGKDSFLSTLLMLDKGYKVNLVTFDNEYDLKSENVLIGAKRIQKKYGVEKVKILGVKKTDAILRELICSFYNYDIDYIKDNFGKVTISQFNCLSCRLAMYILAIIICKQNKINLVVDGARRNQLFAIEQDEMIGEFKKLFKQYEIEINYPLLDEINDYTVKNEILAHGFVPKMTEMQCLVGMPILKNAINEEIVNGCFNVYNKELFPKIKGIIKKYENIKFEGEYL